MSPVGSGFGGKEDMIYQGMLALLAMRRGGRCGWCFPRGVDRDHRQAPPSKTTRMGLTRDGRIRAVKFHGLRRRRLQPLDRGRDAQGRDPRARPTPSRTCRWTPSASTNNTPSGAFRRSALQTQFATETQLDIAAERLGLDPFEIRRINMMQAGS